MDVGDVQRSVDQTLVHWMLGVFAFFVQVHCLQDRRHTKKSLDRIQQEQEK